MKFTGKGAQFLVDTGTTTPTWTPIGQVQEIGDVSVTADEVEVTTLDAGDYRDYIQGFKDAGEVELTVVWDPGLPGHDDSAGGLIGMFTTGQVYDCAIRWNSSGTGGESFGTFQAFIRDLTYHALNPDDPQTISPVWRIKTPITLVDTLPTTRGASDVKTAAQASAEARRLADTLARAEVSAKTAETGAADRAKSLDDLRRRAAEANARAKQLAADECTKLQQEAAQAAQQLAQQPGQQPRV